jgi:hypothetical protein
MSIQKEATKAALIWGVLLALTLSTQPADMPVYALFIPFVVIGFGTYSLWKLIVGVYTRTGKKQIDLSRRQRAAGIAISMLAVVILGLQSIGEMAPRDILTVTLLALGAYFYFARNLIRD